MPQETLGYVEMEWTCRRCGTKNPGLQKTCQGCGAQMDADQKFEKPADQQLITEAAKLAQTGRGADIHCPYCGTRNAGDAKVCTRCNGDLTKGEKREAGQVVGAYQPGAAAPVQCAGCGTANPAAAARCQACGRPLGADAPPPMAAPASAAAPASRRPARANWVVAVTGVVAALLCVCVGGFLIYQSLNTTDVTGTVQAVQWERSIGIEALVTVQRQAWEDQLPADAQVGTCELKPRQMLNAPDPNRRSEKVCGTPYSVEQGDGTSKVVQDCQYQIYDDYCAYSAREWQEVDRATASGQDLEPYWPDLDLTADQREGRRNELYSVSLAADRQTYDYVARDEADFRQFTPDSRWTLKINGLGGLNAVEPAR
ncbi:MAG: zinc ribbon domain-containing protein [Anaerolineales bacterium]|nr:zinc ribbon domain-containing protein [Anaerolineales bacterium]